MSPIRRRVDAGSAKSVGEMLDASEGAAGADRMYLIRRAAAAGSVKNIGEMPNASEGAPSADHMSLIRRAPSIGSVKSIGETLDASEGAPGVVATHDLNDGSLPSIGEILGNVICFGNMDDNNVDQHFEPPCADEPLFSDESFVLAYEGPPAGSPPLVQRTTLGYDREIEESAHRVIDLASDLTGSVPQDVDVVSRNIASLSGEAESPHPEGGVATRVAQPGAGVSDGHSLEGQHVPDNVASAPRSEARSEREITFEECRAGIQELHRFLAIEQGELRQTREAALRASLFSKQI
ncbi:hypothetical protein ACLOJK_034917 [Asimina triloba]